MGDKRADAAASSPATYILKCAMLSPTGNGKTAYPGDVVPGNFAIAKRIRLRVRTRTAFNRCAALGRQGTKKDVATSPVRFSNA